jgi:putative copper export protein
VLSVDEATIRLFLHVLAATVWVGGQLTLGALVPTLRDLGPDAPRAVARRFNRIAWPAFFVLLATGVWNLVQVKVGDASTEYQVTLFVKLCLVAVSGIGAFLHTQARTKVGLAVWGAVGAIATIAALFTGVWLRTGV